MRYAYNTRKNPDIAPQIQIWRHWSVYLLASASLCVLPIEAKSQTLHAHSKKASASPHIKAADKEEVSVVAAKSFAFQKAQHDPDAATHLDSAELIKKGVTSINDLTKLAPNLVIQSTNGGQAVNFYLRGIGMKDFTQNNIPSVMTYVDGIAYPFSFATAGAFFDLQSVDVTPGPVGFTHGQTDTGGEVSLHTADPTDKLSYGITEDIASYSRNRLYGFVSSPITDKLSFRLAAQSLQGGGWQYNPQTGKNLGDADLTAIRGKLRWRPDTDTTVTLGGYVTVDHSELLNEQPQTNLIPSLNLNTSLGRREALWSCSSAFAQLSSLKHCRAPSEHNTVWGLNGTVSHSFGSFGLESITAYDQANVGEYSDQDASNFASDDSFRRFSQQTFSQEVALFSQNSNRFQWKAGAYYTYTNLDTHFFYNFSDTPSGYMSETNYVQKQNTLNEFINLSYRLSRTVTLHASGNEENNWQNLNGLRTTQYLANNPNAIKSLYQFNDTRTSSHLFNWSGGVDWQALSHLMLYAKVSSGSRPGGFTANNTTEQAQLTPYKPEHLITYEAGFKSDLIPGKLRLNVSVFHNEYKNQVYLGRYVTSARSLGYYVNIPKSENTGVEGSIQLQPIKHLTLRQTIGYQRGHYQNFNTIDQTSVAAFYKVHGYYTPIYKNFNGVDNGMPKLTFNGSAEYVFQPSRRYDLELGLDWSYVGQQALAPAGEGVYKIPSYFLLNGHITFRPNKGRWSVTAYATNLLGNRYYTSGNVASPDVNWLPGAPRFIGGRVSYTY
ncbi:TonB-dependent receptor [Acetobacter okinawensis]|uniref:TonB-dependent receptor n=2 Tax=Acetobacter okinawensis TaxID=1076594 RepID=UPI001BA4CEE0|nr:TonB-dependent receptor [Acetobacter okinawensis]MBS0965699.1 TonB-dependent receptor [Acetobacter okinawensis]MBS0987494.1 TonB-dependent receptor [Acetobacter okinawensis]MCP1214005.1 TonB-dependent receptor [Acetobacter okinawensis]